MLEWFSPSHMALLGRREKISFLCFLQEVFNVSVDFSKLLMFREDNMWGQREQRLDQHNMVHPPLKNITDCPKQIWTFRFFPCVRKSLSPSGAQFFRIIYIGNQEFHGERIQIVYNRERILWIKNSCQEKSASRDLF